MRSVARLLAALGYVGFATAWFLFSGLAATLQCFESCAEPQDAQGWADVAGSWQWEAVFWCGVVGVLAALVATGFGLSRRREAGSLGLALHAAAVGFVLALVATGGSGGADEIAAYAVLMLGAGAVFLWLSERRAPRQGALRRSGGRPSARR